MIHLLALLAFAALAAGFWVAWVTPDRLTAGGQYPSLFPGDRPVATAAVSAAAYCGLSPREFKSGSSVRGRTRLSKSLYARLQRTLHLPTLTATRFNPVLKAFLYRLVAAG